MNKKINEKLLKDIQEYEDGIREKVNNDEGFSDEDLAIMDIITKKIIRLSEIVKIHKDSHHE